MRYMTMLGIFAAGLAAIFVLAGVAGGNAPILLVAGAAAAVGIGSLTGT